MIEVTGQIVIAEKGIVDHIKFNVTDHRDIDGDVIWKIFGDDDSHPVTPNLPLFVELSKAISDAVKQVINVSKDKLNE